MLMNHQIDYLYIKTKPNIDPEFSEKIFICYTNTYVADGIHTIAKGRFKDMDLPPKIIDRELSYLSVMKTHPEYLI